MKSLTNQTNGSVSAPTGGSNWFVCAALAIFVLIFSMAMTRTATTNPSQARDSMSLIELAGFTHFRGIAVDLEDPARIYLATHHGVFLIHPGGSARRISKKKDDFMGFTPHPSKPAVLYASGHPAEGGNLGFIKSTDSGQTWKRIANGLAGLFDFHQMDVSRANPEVIYGLFNGLQVSHDGGINWKTAAPAPAGVADLSASGKEVATLYAATQSGLIISRNGGATWQSAFHIKQSATMVQTTSNGSVYAFIVGVGLIRASDPNVDWSNLNKDFGDSYVLHLAADPVDENKLYALTNYSEVLMSIDGGKSWQSFGTI